MIDITFIALGQEIRKQRYPMSAIPVELAPILHGLTVSGQLRRARIRTKGNPTGQTQVPTGYPVGETAVVHAIILAAAISAENIMGNFVRQSMAQQPSITAAVIGPSDQFVTDVNLMVACTQS